MVRSVTRCIEKGKYRYVLEINICNRQSRLVVIMKNPSTATVDKSDPTMGKVTAWANRNNFGSVTVLNLFAYREKDYCVLDTLSYEDAVGAESNSFIIDELQSLTTEDKLVVAWGAPKDNSDIVRYHNRINEVEELIACYPGINIWRVGDVVTKSSRKYPRHGLMWNEEPKLCEWNK